MAEIALIGAASLIVVLTALGPYAGRSPPAEAAGPMPASLLHLVRAI